MGPMQPHLTHFAINTDDVDATAAFYAAVFGWQFQDYGPPGFVQILGESGSSPMGAIQQRRQLLETDPTVDSNAPSAWTTSTPPDRVSSQQEATS